jgi:hypothetical protein
MIRHSSYSQVDTTVSKLQTKQLPLLSSPDVLMSTVNEYTGGYRLPPPPRDRTQRTPAHIIIISSSNSQTFEDANHTIFQFQISGIPITVSVVVVCGKKRDTAGYYECITRVQT